MRTKSLRFARAASAAVMAGLLAVPTHALAASKVKVGETDYEQAASGEGWTWDGADDMTLNGYNNGPITARGDLTITVSGENSITGGGDFVLLVESDDSSEGNLTLTGDGTLNVDGDGSREIVDGALIDAHNINIEDITLNVGTNTSSGVNTGLYARGTINITDATVTIDTNYIGAIATNISIKNSSVESNGALVVGDYNLSSELIIDSSRVHAYFGEDNWVHEHEDYLVPAVSGSFADTKFSLTGVEGDIEVVTSTEEEYDWREGDVHHYLRAADGNVFEIQVDPIPDDVAEEATATRTITYKFEDGTEAAPTATDTLSFSRAGKRNPLTGETTWDEWVAQSFADVNSPVIKGYTATLVVVAGESATAGDEFTYEVIYVKDAEPEPEPEPAPQPKPAPVLVTASIPQTADPSAATGLIASLGGLLSAAGIALKHRKR